MCICIYIYNYIRTNWLNKMYRNEPILKKVRIKLVYTWNVEKDWVWDGGMFQSKTWDLGTDIWATWLPGRMPRGVEHGKAQNHPCRTVKIHSVHMVEYSMSEMLPGLPVCPTINLGLWEVERFLCDIYGAMQPWINWMNQALSCSILILFWGYHFSSKLWLYRGSHHNESTGVYNLGLTLLDLK